MTGSRYTLLLARLRKQAQLWPTGDGVKAEEQRIDRFLKQQGAQVIGTGDFAKVYGWEGLALKVVRTQSNPAYLSFARFSQRSTMPVLPRIHRMVRTPRFTIVVMEKLVNEVDKARSVAAALQMLFDGNERMVASKIMGRRIDHLDAMKRQINSIHKHNPLSRLDLAGRNIMFRKERGDLRAVLIDPLAG